MLAVAACQPAPAPQGTPLGTPRSPVSIPPAATATYEPTQPVPLASLPAPTEKPPTPGAVSLRAYRLTRVVGGLAQPLYLTHAGLGDSRLFVVEKKGTVRLIDAQGLRPGYFLDITDRVGSQGSEQGLLGIAFHPHYAQSGDFFVDYTDRQGNTVIARYHADPGAAQADPGSESVLLRIDHPLANHNGGQLQFGPDGDLYIGTGDGGGAGDPSGNAQNLTSLLGKILRLDVDGGHPYAVPASNPFADTLGARKEIWAYGLRNPWRFSFDRATGDLWIGDVGQDHYEEIDFQPAGLAGLNYGWNAMEGLHPFGEGYREGFTLPVWEYDHSQGCAVIGGYVYRGKELPELAGTYLFSDNCSGTLWDLFRTPQGDRKAVVLLQSGLRVSSLGEDSAGEIYLLDLGGGVYRLSQAGS